MTSIRTPKSDPTGKGYPEWLKVIHAANDADPGIFGEPESQGKWWAGGYVEEYADARVVHRSDPSVSIVSKTERGDKALRAAAEALGIHVN